MSSDVREIAQRIITLRCWLTQRTTKAVPYGCSIEFNVYSPVQRCPNPKQRLLNPYGCKTETIPTEVPSHLLEQWTVISKHMHRPKVLSLLDDNHV